MGIQHECERHKRLLPQLAQSNHQVTGQDTDLTIAFTLVQEQPPGMHLIYLPFADDIRHPEIDPSIVGTTQVFADDQDVAAANALIEALYVPDFQVGGIPNPALQRHFQVITSSSHDALRVPSSGQSLPGLIEALYMPDFQVEGIPNPALQRHFQVKKKPSQGLR